MEGEIRVVNDVPGAFADLVTAAFHDGEASRFDTPFRLVASGGNSGAACFGAVSSSDMDFSKIELYFADERCVEPTTPDSNQFAIARALGAQRERLAGFFPMSCDDGASLYEQRLREVGHLDLIQLGLGPDGHTASLFPLSSALDLPSDRLVAINADPSGNNVHDRMTLTYGAIAMGSIVVVTVIGQARAQVLREIVDGADYPASRLHAAHLIWLIDRAAATRLEGATP
jgi:6-phosphogluconolactonase